MYFCDFSQYYSRDSSPLQFNRHISPNIMDSQVFSLLIDYIFVLAAPFHYEITFGHVVEFTGLSPAGRLRPMNTKLSSSQECRLQIMWRRPNSHRGHTKPIYITKIDYLCYIRSKKHGQGQLSTKF